MQFLHWTHLLSCQVCGRTCPRLSRPVHLRGWHLRSGSCITVSMRLGHLPDLTYLAVANPQRKSFGKCAFLVSSTEPIVSACVLLDLQV